MGVIICDFVPSFDTLTVNAFALTDTTFGFRCSGYLLGGWISNTDTCQYVP